MFYLINEKDGLSGDGILVNALNLKCIHVSTSSKRFDINFKHKTEEKSFSYSPEEIFNVDNLIQNISQLTNIEYSNNFIVLTDIENIKYINENFQKKLYLHNKVITILMNINEIELVYNDKGHYILSTCYRDFHIKESPEEVFCLIKNKIVHNLTTNSVENKLQIKHRL